MTTLKQFAIELPAIRDEAKVIWGTKHNYKRKHFHRDGGNGYDVCERCGHVASDYDDLACSEFRLTQMLLSDNPVEYLEENT